jgi:hypothetical protein
MNLPLSFPKDFIHLKSMKPKEEFKDRSRVRYQEAEVLRNQIADSQPSTLILGGDLNIPE